MGRNRMQTAAAIPDRSREMDEKSWWDLWNTPHRTNATARQKSQQASPPPGASAPTYEAADFHDTALPSQPFDIIVCVDAISYFRDKKLCLSKMGKSLRPEGHLVLTTVNPFVYDRI